MGEVRFMISEAAKQVDVESHVLRYWEEELGLTIGRTEMGHRYYTKDDIQLFRCIKKLKDEGMLLRELKPLIPELKETRLRMKEPEDPGISTESAAPAVSGTPGGAVSAPAAAASPAVSASPAHSASADVMIPLDKVEQVRALVGEVLREALADNNSILQKDISSTVTADVVHEIDFLLQAKERQQEEHFRRLDSLIRQQQAARKESARGGAVMKLRKLFT